MLLQSVEQIPVLLDYFIAAVAEHSTPSPALRPVCSFFLLALKREYPQGLLRK